MISGIGIDVGKRGSIVVLQENFLPIIYNIEIIGNEIDINGINNFLLNYIDQSHCVIEDVHSIFGAGAKSNFQFGRALGIIEGIVSSLGIPYTKVAPKKWQAEMWQGIRPVEIYTGKKKKNGEAKTKIDTKATSAIAAKRLFPNVDFRKSDRSKKDSDGAIDAALMATYCVRNFLK
jgi:hypothetical protein